MHMDIGSAITILFGLLFVAFGFLNHYLTAGRFGKNAREATGVVVDVVDHGGGRRGGIDTAVRFTTAEGKEIVFKDRRRGTDYIVGQTLVVSYEPANPEGATIGSLSSISRLQFFTSAGTILFGLFWVFAGLGSAFGIWGWRPTARR